ncbi:FG-GAP-like repeat-containing protein [Streptomyces sp. NPDC059989]|uniref:FG-GAP-like repeat-containing protein n=1 Tax=Streptomyces sp. NPDC059989 TaxID=3347026 RepID=UPI00368C327E
MTWPRTIRTAVLALVAALLIPIGGALPSARAADRPVTFCGSVINVINCRWGVDRAAYNIVSHAYNFFNGSTVTVQGGNLYLGNAGVYRNNTFVADRIIIHENAVEGLTAPGNNNVFIGNVEIARVNQVYREVVELRECTTDLVRTTAEGWNFESVDSAGGVRPNGLIGVADLNAAIGDTDAPDEMRDCARLLARFDYEHFSAVQTEQGAQDNRQANRDDFQRFSDHIARCEEAMERESSVSGPDGMLTALLNCAREGNENGPPNPDPGGPGGNATQPDPENDGNFPGQNTVPGDWTIGSGLGVGAIKDELEKRGLPQLPAAAGITDVRMLPLGDSITYGVGAAGGSSYRGRLWDFLAHDLHSLDFVGSAKSGTGPDRDHEGHKGWSIDQIDAMAGCTVARYRPNVVTLHIGTNDMNGNNNVDQAPARLRALIDKIVDAAPETTVLVATLVPSSTPEVNERIKRYNAAIPGIVNSFRAAGDHVRLVDMNALTPEDLNDWLHPKAIGYEKMANAFYRGIHQAMSDGWIARPRPQDPSPCATQRPATDDGWDWKGTVASGVGAPRSDLRWADLNGDGRDDYLVLDGQGRIRAWLNDGPAPGSGWNWKWTGEVASGVGATRDQVRLTDLNGDGRADYLVVDDQGRARAWLNAGPATGGGWTWEWKGEVASGVGATRDQVRFADLNGDKRADYLVLDGQGRARAWLNAGPATGGGWTWEWKGEVASGVGAARDQVRLIDLNGDNRVDYLVLGDHGQVRAWLNNGPASSGGGWGWKWAGEVASGVGAPRDNIDFADLDGDRRNDYVVVRDNGAATGWLNDRIPRS